MKDAALVVPDSVAPGPDVSSPIVSAPPTAVPTVLLPPQASPKANQPQEPSLPKPRIALQPSAGAPSRLFAQALRMATGSVLTRTSPPSDTPSDTSSVAPKLELVSKAEAGPPASKLCAQAATFAPGASLKCGAPERPSSPKPASGLKAGARVFVPGCSSPQTLLAASQLDPVPGQQLCPQAPAFAPRAPVDAKGLVQLCPSKPPPSLNIGAQVFVPDLSKFLPMASLASPSLPTAPGKRLRPDAPAFDPPSQVRIEMQLVQESSFPRSSAGPSTGPQLSATGSPGPNTPVFPSLRLTSSSSHGVAPNAGAHAFSPSQDRLVRASPTAVPSQVSVPSEPGHASPASLPIRPALLLPATGSSSFGLRTDAPAFSSHSDARPSAVQPLPLALVIKPPTVSKPPACSSSSSSLPSDKLLRVNAPIFAPRGVLPQSSPQLSPTALRPGAVVLSPQPPPLVGSQREPESKAPLLLPQVSAVASPIKQVDSERLRTTVPKSTEPKISSYFLPPVSSVSSSSTPLPVSSPPSPSPSSLAELRARATSFSPKSLFMNAIKASSGK